MSSLVKSSKAVLTSKEQRVELIYAKGKYGIIGLVAGSVLAHLGGIPFVPFI